MQDLENNSNMLLKCSSYDKFEQMANTICAIVIPAKKDTMFITFPPFCNEKMEEQIIKENETNNKRNERHLLVENKDEILGYFAESIPQ